MKPAAVAVALAALVSLATAANAQQGVRTIRPGMTEEEVRQVLGDPLYERSYEEHTYYMYDNGCEKECGFLDLVIFRSGQVTDAVFRADWHEYAGQSSSPKGVQPRPTPGGEALEVPRGEVESIEVRPARPEPEAEQQEP